MAITAAQARAGSGSQSNTYRWPASFSDGGWPNFTGTVWLGSLLAIPPTFNIETTGWNAASKVLARTIQKFGIYTVATSANAGLYAEIGGIQTPITDMTTYINSIRDQIRLVNNNTASTVGGGGTYPAILWPVPTPTLP